MKPMKIPLVMLLALLAGPGLVSTAAAGERERGHRADGAGDRARGDKAHHRRQPAHLGQVRHRVHRGHHRKQFRHGHHRKRYDRGHRRLHPRWRHRGGRYLPYWHRYRHHGQRRHAPRYRQHRYHGYGVSFELDGIRYRFGEYGLR